MANPRQRSKAKSHKSTKPNLNQKKRIHAKLRKAPPLKGPETLQKAWDKKKTVFQNYRALGLLPSIPLPKGASSSRSQRVALPVNADGEGMDIDGGEAAVPKVTTFGRIIRDEDGNVIDIIIDEPEDKDEEEEQGRWKPLNEAEDKEVETVEAKTEVVKELEALAATAAPVVRHSSAAERIWLSRLVKKHGDDYEDMSRDHKLNVWQKTPGELKRMVKKAGGVEKLKLVVE